MTPEKEKLRKRRKQKFARKKEKKRLQAHDSDRDDALAQKNLKKKGMLGKINRANYPEVIGAVSFRKEGVDSESVVDWDYPSTIAKKKEGASFLSNEPPIKAPLSDHDESESESEEDNPLIRVLEGKKAKAAQAEPIIEIPESNFGPVSDA